MRRAGEIPRLNYDKEDNSQSMATFEIGDGKESFETVLANKLAPGVDEDENL